MAVKQTISNKPPPPEPQPPPAQYPIHLTYEDGREVWVSNPKPDRLALIGSITLKHFKAESDLAKAVINTSQMLQVAGGKMGAGDNPKFDPKSGLYKELNLKAGSREANVHVRFIKPTKGHGWKLRLEFNPRKLRPAGFQAMIDDFKAQDSFQFDRWLADAHLTRLDIAVDVVGLRVSEVLATVGVPSKKVFYVGDDGLLESQYFHRLKPPPKQNWAHDGSPKKVAPTGPPLGRAILKIYDRVKERARMLKPPPFGPSPVTRLEMMKVWQGHAPPISQMPVMAKLLEGGVAGYVGRFPPCDRKTWLAYVDIRRIGGRERAQSLLPMKLQLTAKVAEAFDKPKNDLLGSKGLAAGWIAGLAETGLEKLVGLAAHAEFNTFSGGQVVDGKFSGELN